MTLWLQWVRLIALLLVFCFSSTTISISSVHRLLMVCERHTRNCVTQKYVYFWNIAALLMVSIHHHHNMKNVGDLLFEWWHRIYDIFFFLFLFFSCEHQNIINRVAAHNAFNWTIRRPWTICVYSAYHWHIITFAPYMCSLCVLPLQEKTQMDFGLIWTSR